MALVLFCFLIAVDELTLFNGSGGKSRHDVYARLFVEQMCVALQHLNILVICSTPCTITTCDKQTQPKATAGQPSAQYSERNSIDTMKRSETSTTTPLARDKQHI